MAHLQFVGQDADSVQADNGPIRSELRASIWACTLKAHQQFVGPDAVSVWERNGPIRLQRLGQRWAHTLTARDRNGPIRSQLGTACGPTRL
jgi:hypothetical protein